MIFQAILTLLLFVSIFGNVYLYIKLRRQKKEQNRKPSDRIDFIDVRTQELQKLGATDEEIEAFERTKRTYHGEPIYRVPSSSRIYHKWRTAFKNGDIK